MTPHGGRGFADAATAFCSSRLGRRGTDSVGPRCASGAARFDFALLGDLLLLRGAPTVVQPLSSVSGLEGSVACRPWVCCTSGGGGDDDCPVRVGDAERLEAGEEAGVVVDDDQADRDG